MSVELACGALRHAHAAAVVPAADRHAGRLAVLGIADRHVAHVDARLALDDADLHVGAAGHRALVALDLVEALDEDLLAGAVDAQDPAGLALVLAGDDD